jgi:hypothetical protein
MSEIIDGSIESKEKKIGFFTKYFVELPKSFWRHIAKNFWLYVSIIIGIASIWFFNTLANLVGGFKNATYVVTSVLTVTGLLWLWKIDALQNTMKHLKKFWYWYTLATVLSLFVLYIFEGSLLHSYLMIARENSFMVFLIPLMIYSFKLLIKKETKTYVGRVIVVSLAFIVSGSIATYIYFGGQQYVAQYFKYNQLKDQIVWLDEKPNSINERIFPRDVYRSIIEQSLGDNNIFSDPDMIFKNGHTKFVSSAIPLKKVAKFFEGSIDTVVEIDADNPNVDKTMVNKEVHFSVGEGLMWSRDIYNYAVKSLHHRYFNVFPTNVQILDNDKNESVMIVSLASWDGILFPTPEFYGVMIIEQGDISWAKRAIVGGAKIVKKEEISSYKWLLKQNLNSEISTRYAAESLKFENGFVAPMSFVHDDDIIMTDMEGDRNDLPLISAFAINDDKKLFDFFELKPWKESSTNARDYLYFPSDGQDKIYGYKPKNVVSIAELTNKVKGSVNYNTEQKYKFAEPRPYFKNSLPEVFMVSRVLKRRNGSFDPSGIKTYLIDAQGTQNKVVEVDTYNVDTWEEKAIEAFIKY